MSGATTLGIFCKYSNYYIRYTCMHVSINMYAIKRLSLQAAQFNSTFLVEQPTDSE